MDTTKIETSVLLDDYSLIKGSKRVANFLTSLRGFPWRWNDPPVTTVDLQSKSLADARTGNDFRTNNSSEELIYRVSWERGKIPSRLMSLFLFKGIKKGGVWTGLSLGIFEERDSSFSSNDNWGIILGKLHLILVKIRDEKERDR